MRAPGPRAVPAATVPRWSQAAPAPAPLAPQLPVDAAVNDRFAIWHGDITTLEVDAISYPTDETLSHSNPVSDRVLLQAGAGMKEDIVTRGLVAPPGGVAVTRGHALRCRHVLHVASRHARSEHALRECYRSVLAATLQLQSRSAALALLPAAAAEPAARAALHAVRAHLSRHAAPALVVLTAARAADAALLAALAPGYFPRPAPRAPPLRLIANPRRDADHADDDGSLDEEEAAAAAAALADSARLLHAPRPAPRSLAYDQYERLLRRADTEDLSSVSGIGCLYRSGVDRLGRPVVVFIGKWFPIADIDLDKALLYLIKLLDPIVSGDYVIAYFHTLAASGNHPPFSWLKEVYTVLPYKYKKNLKAFYIVHPTFWTKMMSWWFTTFMAPAIKAKVHNLPGVEYLHAAISRDQLEVPAFVTEYDMTINGLHYFQPEISSSAT